MPVLVQWKWEEKTKTYLVIFHFLDDFSAPNLRMSEAFMSKAKFGDKEIVYRSPHAKWTSIMTWAPSHPELGLLSEVLSYANIINGLDYDKKSEVRRFLEGEAFYVLKDKKLTHLATVTEIELLVASQFRQLLRPSKEGIYQAFWLTPEYMEYLKKVLERTQEPDSVKKDLKVDVAVKVFRLKLPT